MHCSEVTNCGKRSAWHSSSAGRSSSRSAENLITLAGQTSGSPEKVESTTIRRVAKNCQSRYTGGIRRNNRQAIRNHRGMYTFYRECELLGWPLPQGDSFVILKDFNPHIGYLYDTITSKKSPVANLSIRAYAQAYLHVVCKVSNLANKMKCCGLKEEERKSRSSRILPPARTANESTSYSRSSYESTWARLECQDFQNSAMLVEEICK
ncbi:hypothetical protein BDQ12DRAFT_666068 [Crucibulum laeve]|uniref:Uncharacterized protein n=1 Tax=Crucibulum laeve TaxID=68775 RepID=A0A5C3LYX8_9AGAR|nr:hypothetical protein BDQ12DRAFT_666068 [Crucibulum laeve]